MSCAQMVSIPWLLTGNRTAASGVLARGFGEVNRVCKVADVPVATARCRRELIGRASVLGTEATSEAPKFVGDVYLGLDFGTSGARAVACDGDGAIVADARSTYHANNKDESLTETWLRVLFAVICAIPAEVRAATRAVALDGTSGSVLLVDLTSGAVLAQPKMYNEAQGAAARELVQGMAPPEHTVTAPTSALCKLAHWWLEGLPQRAGVGQVRLLHQADWLLGQVVGSFHFSDYNNCLKLGYDPQALEYPQWLRSQDFAPLLPPVVLPPGHPVGPVSAALAQRLGLPADCVVCAGTTDSIAAFLASGAAAAGEAVTSLGSSLALKLVSDRPVEDARFGVYSHRLGDLWLVGGASNSGGAVLRKYFSDQQISALSELMDISRPTGLNYYPLTCPGERFPTNDPSLTPRLEPRPADDVLFLQGILEGIARIEADAYRLLAEMGATPVSKVFTAGGGAKNDKWTAMRAAMLDVPVLPSPRSEAAYGAALLAQAGVRQYAHPSWPSCPDG